MLWDVIDSSVNQEFPWCKLMGGRVVDVSPIRSCQRTGSRAVARRGRANQLSPLWHWLRPSIWLRPTLGGEKPTRPLAPRTRRQECLHTSRRLTQQHGHTRTWRHVSAKRCMPEPFWVIGPIWCAVHTYNWLKDRWVNRSGAQLDATDAAFGFTAHHVQERLSSRSFSHTFVRLWNRVVFGLLYILVRFHW